MEHPNEVIQLLSGRIAATATALASVEVRPLQPLMLLMLRLLLLLLLLLLLTSLLWSLVCTTGMA